MTRPAMRLAPHPRLFVTPDAIANMRQKRCPWLLKSTRASLAKCAAEYATRTTVEYPAKQHNAHLLRARTMQGEVFALLAQYIVSGDRKCRDNVVRRVRAMGEWEYWSWIRWRENDPDPNAIFDLSYGENSVTIGLAYDILFDVLSVGERAMFQNVARRRSLIPFLKNTPGKSWWFKHARSNWNTVCAGGAGVLALAMYEDVPDAPEVVRLAEISFKPYMNYLKKIDGGWEEGVGYWNFGMTYAFMYLLSHENATGRHHPLLRQAATRKTLHFPLDFAPNGVAAGFGDANGWTPLPIHVAVAERLNDREVVNTLLDLMRKRLKQNAARRDVELLFFYPYAKHRLSGPSSRDNVAKLYKNLDWGFLADRMPNPSLYCSIRGGDTRVAHGHTNVTSFNVVVGDEAMIIPPSTGYMDSTFSPRRFDIFELGPHAKNVVLVNGVGVLTHSRVETRIVRLAHGPAVRIDATEAMGPTRQDTVAVNFLGRLYTILDNRAVLVIDRIEAPHAAVVETRIHTPATPTPAGTGALLVGKRQCLRVAYGSTVPASTFIATDPVSRPSRGSSSTQVRWVADDRETITTFATLLVPGRSRASVSVKDRAGRLTVKVTIGKLSRVVRVSGRLMPI